jgi:hypothetical protein
MCNAFRLVFRTSMTPWTQECVYFVLLTVCDAGIGVERDPTKGGLGLEEQWFAPWSDVVSLQHVHSPESIVRIEFSTAGGQTTIRDIRVPSVRERAFAGCSGTHLLEAILLAYREKHHPPTVEQVLRMLPKFESQQVKDSPTAP